MNPIAPPQVINNGIALFAPAAQENRVPTLITLEIYYQENNPVFSWIQCDTGRAKIWSKTVAQPANGTLFIYETKSELPLGFYTLKLISRTATNQETTGQLLLGVISPTPYLIVGLPYSIYPPIDLA